MNKSPIDLGTLQAALTLARRTHAANSKALTKAQDAHKRSKAALESATAALDDGSRSILSNG